MKYIVFILLILGACKTNTEKENAIPNLKDENTQSEGFNFEGCGECLFLDTGRVCTTRGTYYNSCLAICRRVKILCDGECPCRESQK